MINRTYCMELSFYFESGGLAFETGTYMSFRSWLPNPELAFCEMTDSFRFIMDGIAKDIAHMEKVGGRVINKKPSISFYKV